MIFLVGVDHFWISLGHLLSLFFQASERAYHAHKLVFLLRNVPISFRKIDTHEIFMIYSA